MIDIRFEKFCLAGVKEPLNLGIMIDISLFCYGLGLIYDVINYLKSVTYYVWLALFLALI